MSEVWKIDERLWPGMLNLLKLLMLLCVEKVRFVHPPFFSLFFVLRTLKRSYKHFRAALGILLKELYAT